MRACKFALLTESAGGLGAICLPLGVVGQTMASLGDVETLLYDREGEAEYAFASCRLRFEPEEISGKHANIHAAVSCRYAKWDLSLVSPFRFLVSSPGCAKEGLNPPSELRVSVSDLRAEEVGGTVAWSAELR